MCHSSTPGDGGFGQGVKGCGGNMLMSDAKRVTKPPTRVKSNLASLRRTALSFLDARRSVKKI